MYICLVMGEQNIWFKMFYRQINKNKRHGESLNINLKPTIKKSFYLNFKLIARVKGHTSRNFIIHNKSPCT